MVIDVISYIDFLGTKGIGYIEKIGDFGLFLHAAVKAFFTTRPKFKQIITQIQIIGVNSLVIVVLTGAFTGIVLAFQIYSGFKRFGGEEFIGPVVAISMIRELGPVLTGLMVTGRAGSAIAAELGSMRISEQIDALRTLCINTWQYLMVPRIFASIFILPFLSLFTMLFGIIGGYFTAVYILHLNGEQYMSGIQKYVELSDITNGLIKSAVFGLILSWVGCYRGYNTRGGARGIGLATTQSVVISSIMILIANYFLTVLLFE